MELSRMRQTEATGFLNFDRVVISSPADATNVASLSGGLVEPNVLPNLVDLNRFTFVASGRFPNRIIFAAKLDYAPNAEAAGYLIRTVMPLVWARRPQAEVIVVGSNPPASLTRLNRQPHVTVRGFVNDLSAQVAQASVAVAPLLVKAGTQYKILEAMTVGTPVVATELACQGLYVQDNRELLIGSSAHEFAAGILRILESPDLAERMRHSGRRYVERNHDAASIARQLEAVYVEMLRGRATA
jgi:glycosyltransferase involved in cell wall biosynthesis